MRGFGAVAWPCLVLSVCCPALSCPVGLSAHAAAVLSLSVAVVRCAALPRLASPRFSSLPALPLRCSWARRLTSPQERTGEATPAEADERDTDAQIEQGQRCGRGTHAGCLCAAALRQTSSLSALVSPHHAAAAGDLHTVAAVCGQATGHTAATTTRRSAQRSVDALAKGQTGGRQNGPANECAAACCLGRQRVRRSGCGSLPVGWQSERVRRFLNRRQYSSPRSDGSSTSDPPLSQRRSVAVPHTHRRIASGALQSAVASLHSFVL